MVVDCDGRRYCAVRLRIDGNPSAEFKEKAAAREAIAFCWKEQGTKSLEASSQRFIAATCEKLEKDFREKYALNP